MAGAVEPGLGVEALDLGSMSETESAMAQTEPNFLTSTPIEEAVVALEAEPEFVLAEAEFAPLGAGEADELEDAFVELIEE